MKFKLPSQEQIKDIFARFPATVITTLIAMALMIFLIEVDGPKFEYFEDIIKIVFVLTLGIFMFTSIRLLGDKNSLCIVGIVALIAYYFILPDMKEPTSIIFTRHFFLILMFFIMTWWAVFWKKSVTNEEFWEWNQQIVFGFLTSIVFTLVLFGGLSGALYAVDSLFSLDIDGKRYAQLIVLVSGLFGVNYFLSQIPKTTENLTSHTYTKVETIFTKYILTPLVIGYFLILYAYSFKILISGSWPKGILAWIIIAFSAVAIITYLFWTPLWSERAKKYKRFFALGLWLQTIMLGIAIWMRVDAYSWTESRYMVALLGGWLFVMSLYFLLFKDAKYKWLFITLSAIILVSQVGYFSSYAVGERSQQTRLSNMIKENTPLTKKTDIQIRYEISDMIDYLSRRFGMESLEKILPKVVEKYKKDNTHEDVYNRYGFAPFATKELGFNYVDKWQLKESKDGIKPPHGFYRRQNHALSIKGYDWICDVMYNGYEHSKQMPVEFKTNLITAINTELKLDDKVLNIIENNKTIATIELESFYKKVLNDEELNNLSYRVVEPLDINWSQKLDINYGDEKVKVKIMFFEINADANGSLMNIFAKVLYRRKSD